MTITNLTGTINVPVPFAEWNTTGTTTTWYDAQGMQTWYKWTSGTTTSSYVITDEEQQRMWVDWQPYAVRQVEWIRYQAEQAVYQRAVADREQRERERQSRIELYQAQQLKRTEERIMAHARALDLLKLILTPDQQQEMQSTRCVTVFGQSGKRYRVEMHRETVHGNIVELDGHGCPLRRGCIAPDMYVDSGALPTPDGWVGQVLAIQHNEGELVARANWSDTRRCQQPNVPILEAA